MTYETGNIGGVSATLQNFQFRLNSLYDPQYAVGGGQPRGFDQWAGLYANYRVHGCKVVVYAQMLTAGYQGIMSLCHRTTAVAPADLKEVLEQPAVTKKAFTGDKPGVVSKYYDLAKCLSVSKMQYNSDDLYWAGIGADPDQILLGNISFVNTDEATSSNFVVRATITYYCEFFKPLILGSS